MRISDVCGYQSIDSIGFCLSDEDIFDSTHRSGNLKSKRKFVIEGESITDECVIRAQTDEQKYVE